ncbi:hypothetical protein [Burkholderia mallei]|uniref:hypothetical protein n=1 Tax=Burkholderia mallei TaxID=13373 RepID=UPI0000F27825|nr:hypothetical protein [Burkholderia mallei]EDK55618.1 hypothetical protein BMAFMH_E0719 [Burkholderia mallei FMH]EDK61542.1 hypothetical protein BMAJHU_I0638 [Burkholderia mallei JHU]EDK86158.1 conserved hypothetical protein [Burkholderia mallei 2002721280]EDP87325.1 conserved hypothetical protein [Burkholderia mallei ATCC 10399]EEP84018.1 conserved hypothetical protein [Burkholderia mallei GB8 horse 4]EES46311.1 conserved hypothetical protein [Burkholderia mallei PRL-20]
MRFGPRALARRSFVSARRADARRLRSARAEGMHRRTVLGQRVRREWPRREWPHSHPMSCARTRGPRIGARDDNHDAGTHHGASYAIDGTTQPSDNAIIKPNGTAFIGTAQRARA